MNKLDKGMEVFSLFTSVPHAVLKITKKIKHKSVVSYNSFNAAS